ncbi:MAG: cytochrome c nitrite reductase small subunit [Lentimicrobiaceae bacterium]|nr:cytochrome c nitrite reductase small subunit [Lentimicrobiaceae bacterium]
MIKKIIQIFTPPPQWRVPVIIALGIFTGFSAYIFYTSRAWSYLSDDPQACVNCHIMTPEYATWSHSSHKHITNCNECHVPHNNVFNKYFFKAKDGLYHASIFTLRAEPQVIHAKEASIKVIKENCERCHTDAVDNEKMLVASVLRKDSEEEEKEEERLCWECHRETPHGRVHSLASTPYAFAPRPESPVPDWLKKEIKSEFKRKRNAK